MSDFWMGFFIGSMSGENSKKDEKKDVKYSEGFANFAWGAFNVGIVLFVLLIFAGCILAWL